MFNYGLDETVQNKLTEKINHHKQRFISIFRGRYREMLPTLIQYNNENTVSVNFLKVEHALRSGYDVAIGMTKNGNIQILGYVKTKESSENPSDMLTSKRLHGSDIEFIIPKHLREVYYKEITNYDSCQTGNFVVLRNKILNYVQDYEILEHYVQELSEIVLSRYSISMQVKISTIFKGNLDDTSLENLVSDIYNGKPYITVNKLFDFDENVYKFNNEGLVNAFSELKTEYQHKISELNNMLGVNSLAVDKESGVSDVEANSNTGYTTSNANIYLESRNESLNKLNKRYNLKLQATYNDKVSSELQSFSERMEVNE